jgi:AcrR family transcriptional regulator
METARRLSADDRRAQLLEIGRALFNTRPYVRISVDEIAEAAGISKGLLYHYFGSKNAFFLAGLREGSREFLAACSPDPGVSPARQIEEGIGSYLDYVEANSLGYLNLFQDEIASVPELAAVCDETREAILERFLAGVPPGLSTPASRLALRGFIRHAEAIVLDWLEHRSIGRSEVERLLVSSLASALLAGLRIDLGPDAEELRQLERDIGDLR